MKTKVFKLGVLIGFFVLIFGTANLWAEEESPSASADVAFLSKYVWRGQELSRGSMVIQPSLTISYMGFSGNLWGNLDTDQYKDDEEDHDWTETDLTLSYGRAFGMLSAEAGYIYYALEGTDADTQEVFLTLGLDTFLSPSLTVYKDISEYPSWYFLLGISHAFEITEKVSLELSGSISYLLSEDEDDYPEIDSDGVPTDDEFENFHDGVISASLPVAVTKYITITPSLSYTFPLSSDASDEMEYRSFKGDDDNFIYGGVTLSMAF
ncbi:MAG: hypothetical protein SRB2_01951 [Desulfobacteraceae bacterium Eth-SRB2]|nr:MAG: hypothetical protein SRB2_01951 [Desulfobacteraceae bacterium Eth-SRB2]